MSNFGGCVLKKAWNVSFVFIGLVIGAGFASGREILEYFTLASPSDPTGIVFAAISFAATAYITMRLSAHFGTHSFSGFISAVAGKAALPVKAFMLLYMFCGFFVMLSGSGALFSEAFPLRPFFGIALLAAICFVTFAFDIRGLVAVNAVLVPIMSVGISLLCISALCFECIPTFSPFGIEAKSPILSALCYVSYNTITAGAVLVPLSREISKSAMRRGALFSGLVLGTLIFLVWLVLSTYFDKIITSPMPLLKIAQARGKIFEITYTAVLFMALCTTAVSHGYGILAQFPTKNRLDRLLAAAILCLSAIPFARFGFSDLISRIYSSFGCLGILWLGCILLKYLKSDI